MWKMQLGPEASSTFPGTILSIVALHFPAQKMCLVFANWEHTTPKGAAAELRLAPERYRSVEFSLPPLRLPDIILYFPLWLVATAWWESALFVDGWKHHHRVTTAFKPHRCFVLSVNRPAWLHLISTSHKSSVQLPLASMRYSHPLCNCGYSSNI